MVTCLVCAEGQPVWGCICVHAVTLSEAEDTEARLAVLGGNGHCIPYKFLLLGSQLFKWVEYGWHHVHVS